VPKDTGSWWYWLTLQVYLNPTHQIIATMLNSLANFVIFFSPVATFVVFAIQAKIQGHGSLDMNLAFTSLAIIQLVSLYRGMVFSIS
jgi:hypothetical protein